LFIEAPETEEQIAAIATRVNSPKLINMFSGGKTPVISTARWTALGFQIVIIPSDLRRATMINWRHSTSARSSFEPSSFSL
jgi:2-methylisocitrate lyase-like PEP mutase family enzyme